MSSLCGNLLGLNRFMVPARGKFDCEKGLRLAGLSLKVHDVSWIWRREVRQRAVIIFCC